MKKTCDLVAIFTTHEPNESLLVNLRALAKQVSEIIVVDDGSQSASSLQVLHYCSGVVGVTLMNNEQNLGIAYSLNRGMAEALTKGYEWALTMDQDSLVSPGFVESILQTREQYTARERVAMVTPNIVDSSYSSRSGKLLLNNTKPWFRLASMDKNDRDDVLIAITSGCLTHLPKIEQVGGFTTDFFIDYVDTQVCLRLIQKGYLILFSGKAELSHNLGSPESADLAGRTVRMLNHGAFRRYYIARNTVYMYAEFWRTFPNWVMYDLCMGFYSLVTIVLFESQKKDKLTNSIKGLYHGILGIKGKLH